MFSEPEGLRFNLPETTKLVRRLSIQRAMMRTILNVKGQRSKVKVIRQISAIVADATWLM